MTCAARARPWACARSTSASTPARPSSPRTPPTCTRATRSGRRVRGRADRQEEDHGAGRRPEPHRPGHRVRLLLRPRRASPCARTATRPSWSTATPRPSRPTTTPRDRLYFEPLTLEDVLEIVDKEKPVGVIVQYGGQTPLKLALALEANGVPIIGTTPDIDRHRRGPRALPEAAQRARPEAAAQPHRPHRERGAGARPPSSATRWSCARAMCWAAARWKSCTSDSDLERYMREAVQASADKPGAARPLPRTTPSRSTSTASATARPTVIGGMHGAHRAGRRALRRLRRARCPPTALAPSCMAEHRRQTAAMAKALKVVGLMNVQFAIQGE